MHVFTGVLTVCSLLSALNAISIPRYNSMHGAPNKLDPVTNLKALEILSYWGYPGEEHHVITKDGYNLTIHRIPHGKNNSEVSKGVVYLQHCLLCSSADFLLNLPTESLGFILADEGYDVWMGKYLFIRIL